MLQVRVIGVYRVRVIQPDTQTGRKSEIIKSAANQDSIG